MLDNVFRCQPSYESDLVKSVNSMVETMNKSVEKMDSITRVTDCDNEKTVETVIDLIIYTTGLTTNSPSGLITSIYLKVVLSVILW